MTTAVKHVAVTAMLDLYPMVCIQLDARQLTVDVPPIHKTNPALVLNYGRDLPIPIQDMTVTPEEIRAVLSFNRTPVATRIPWSAVYAVFVPQAQLYVWEDDIPPELRGPGQQVVQLAAVPADAAPPEDAPVGVAGWQPRVVGSD